MSIIVTSIEGFRTALNQVKHNSDMVLGYTRVSTDQSHQDTSVERQTATYTKLGAAIVVVERESGRSDERPLYSEIIRLIKLGKIQIF